MNLDPNWIVGFADGEGCFQVTLVEHKQMRFGFQVQPEFSITQHEIDIQLLHGIKRFFNCGTVKVNTEDRMMWVVKARKDISDRIIPFFMKHPLKTKKNLEFLTFRKIILKMEKNEHLTEDGFAEIKELASTLRILTPSQQVLKVAAKERRLTAKEAKKEETLLLEQLKTSLSEEQHQQNKQ